MYRLHFDKADNTYCVTEGWKEVENFIWGHYEHTPNIAVTRYHKVAEEVVFTDDTGILDNGSHSILYEAETLNELKLYVLLGD